MDPFHRNKAVRERVHNQKAVKDIMELLDGEKIEELFEYLELYRNSLSEEGEIEDVEELIRYYRNNKEGLLPYQSQGLELPKHPEGLEYRNMGTMENHVWSVIARRMKHNHKRWRKLWRDIDVGKNAKERWEGVCISGAGSFGEIGRKGTGGQRETVCNGRVLGREVWLEIQPVCSIKNLYEKSCQ